MFGALSVVAILCTVYQLIKEACEPTIPAENWANKELYQKDILSGMSVEERMRNVRNGRYKLVEPYPEPHRNSKGQIIIENYELYKEDLKNHNGAEVYRWIRQGKYNLTPEELKIQRKKTSSYY